MADADLTDPMGRTIALSDRAWFGHIVKGHPDMAEHRPLVEAAVGSPIAIHLSRSDEACRLFIGEGPRDGLRIVVVADVRLGVVKTAYLARRIAGGALEWSSPKRLKER